MKRILVTGINGFVGHHVAKTLHDMNMEVVGASNQPTLSPELQDIVTTYYGCDLTSNEEVKQIDLKNIDAIINLAGFANVGDSRGKADLYEKVNVGVHSELYEECLRQGVKPRIIAVSTGAVYDNTQAMPISEDGELVEDTKTNEYVVSKKKMEKILPYFRKKGLDCIIARPFNHTGPGQLPGFLLPDLVEQIQKANKEDGIMKVGNLKTRRDFADVRDVAKAYALLATCPEKSLNHTVYNICSGKSRSGEELLAILMRETGYNNIEIEVDPKRIRKNEVMDIYGSNTQLAEDTGWKPSIELEQTVADFVAWKFR
jgi:GDP-4-dehydro-6-deoxy-D-mannose reductase